VEVIVPELRLSRIIVFAKDIRRMEAFYRDVLGLRRVQAADDSDEFVTFDVGACLLCLHAIPAQYARDIEIADPPEVRSRTPIKVTFLSRDVKRERTELVARGARMDEVREFGDLVLCNGIDVEGNVFQLSNR
jgi:catechol 2,3-dioxygenase-like lactoylglutathione lyase family enzyme